MDSIQLKIEFEDELRRASIPRNESLAQFKATIASLVGAATDCDIKYRDDENDLILIGSDQELREFLATAVHGKPLRVIAVQSSRPAPAVPQTPQQQPAAATPFPFEAVARALSDASVVSRVQQLLQSSILTETVNKAAKAYVESRGGYAETLLAVGPQLPLLYSLVLSVLEEIPALGDLFFTIMTSSCAHAFAAPRAHPHHAHPHGPHHPRGSNYEHIGHPHCQQPHHHGGPHNHKQKHFNIVCDGCSTDHALKQVSIANGHQTRRGFIAGLRFKSQTVHDFDLCESCKASDRFPERAYGPFSTISAPTQWPSGPRGRRGGGGGGCGWWRPNPAPTEEAQSDWRETSTTATTTSTSTSAPQDNQPEQSVGNVFEKLLKTMGPYSTPSASSTDTLVDIGRQIFSSGSKAVAEASKTDSDFSEIAKAIAESLKIDIDQAKPQQESSIATASPASTNDGWVPVAAPYAESAEDPFVKWSTQMQQLQTLGFDNLETYIDILEEENGDLDRVVNRIVRRDL